MPSQVILFLAANPLDTPRLALDQECAAIQRELHMSRSGRNDFELVSRWAVGVDDLMRYVLELDPAVIHFSGHGGGAHGLQLQGEAGNLQTVLAPEFAELIASTSRSARLVVLSACYSVEQAHALVGKVDCVIGMKHSVGDGPARAFSVALYRALGYRCSIGNAFNQAVAALRVAERGWRGARECTRDVVDATDMPCEVSYSGEPVCLPRVGLDAETLYLKGDAPGAVIDLLVKSEVDLEVSLDDVAVCKVDHAAGLESVRRILPVGPRSVLRLRARGFELSRSMQSFMRSSDQSVEIVVGTGRKANVPITEEQRRNSMGAVDDIPTLIVHLQTGRPYAAAWAARCLGAIGDSRALPPLLDVLKKSCLGHDAKMDWVQANVVKALSELGDRAAVLPLQEVLATVPRTSGHRYLLESAIAALRRQ